MGKTATFQHLELSCSFGFGFSQIRIVAAAGHAFLNVRFAPESGHTACIPPGPLCAKEWTCGHAPRTGTPLIAAPGASGAQRATPRMTCRSKGAGEACLGGGNQRRA